MRRREFFLTPARRGNAPLVIFQTWEAYRVLLPK